MTEEFELKCPKCEGIQHCPCESCKERHKQEVVWQWDPPLKASSCGHCGHQMSSDELLYEQAKQPQLWKRVQDDEKVSN
jgi:hypothetical protein